MKIKKLRWEYAKTVHFDQWTSFLTWQYVKSGDAGFSYYITSYNKSYTLSMNSEGFEPCDNGYFDTLEEAQNAAQKHWENTIKNWIEK